MLKARLGELILIFAVIVHSSLTAGILLGVAAAMIRLAVNLGHYYPYPSSFGEVFIGALIAMSLFAVPVALLVRYLIMGVGGLTLTGFAFYFPNWNPEKYTESACAYYWALALNSAWAVCWYLVMDAVPAVGGSSSLDPLFGAAPILVLSGMFYYRASKDGIKIKKKDDPDGSSLDPLKRLRHDIKRKRVVLYTFRGGLGEAVVFGSLIGNLLTQVFLRPHFDSQQFGANVVATIMLFAVWRYIRRTNRRADALLEAQLATLKEATDYAGVPPRGATPPSGPS